MKPFLKIFDNQQSKPAWKASGCKRKKNSKYLVSLSTCCFHQLQIANCQCQTSLTGLSRTYTSESRRSSSASSPCWRGWSGRWWPPCCCTPLHRHLTITSSLKISKNIYACIKELRDIAKRILSLTVMLCTIIKLFSRFLRIGYFQFLTSPFIIELHNN